MRGGAAGLVVASGASWLAGWAGVFAAVLVGAVLGYLRRSARRDAARRRASAGWQRSFVRMAGSLESGADLVSALRSGAGAARLEPPRPAAVSPRFGSLRRGPVSALPEDLLNRAAAFAALGGDPSQTLAGEPGRGAEHLAVALATSDGLGLAIRPVLATLAKAEVDHANVGREVDLALSTARATIRLLAALPMIGLALTVLVDPPAAVRVFSGPGGRFCLVAGAVVEAVGLLWTQRIADRAVSAGHLERSDLDFALAADLLAASSAAGVSLVVAARVVGSNLRGPAGDRLAGLAAGLFLGLGGTGATYRDGEGDAVAGLETIVAASDREGIPPGPALRSLSRQLRAEVAAAQRDRAHRVGVASVAPLGLCFLPAFVLVSVVPVLALAFGQLGS